MSPIKELRKIDELLKECFNSVVGLDRDEDKSTSDKVDYLIHQLKIMDRRLRKFETQDVRIFG